MAESVTNLPCLQQSVSFGRFEHDSLCWERWSTFPSNKYLEEVEKCSTPGSVARKKAYFEAHYKKIAARRAELLVDQEREREAEELANQEDSGAIGLACNASEDELDDKKADMWNSVDTADGFDDEVGGFDGEVTVEHVSVVNDSAGVSSQENEIGGIDGEVSAEHVDVKSDTASVFSQDNDLFDLDLLPGYLSDHIEGNQTVNDVSGHMSEHIDGTQTVDDVNEAGNLISDECEDVGGSKDYDNAIHELSTSEHIDDTQTVNDVNKEGNLISDECEDVGVVKDDDNVIHEVSETVSIVVTKNVGEGNDLADVDEVVNKEIIKVTYEPYDGPDLIDESGKRPQDESCAEDLCLGLKIPESSQLKEPVSEIENAPSIVDELPQEMVKRTIAEEGSKKRITLASPKKLQKATLAKKTTSATNAKNVPASPIRRTSALMPKSPMLSTPRSSKPEPTKFSKSANHVLDKKENSFTPSSVKKTAAPQSKRVVPTSMHTSLSLEPMNSGQTSLTRKSLIMESMGDKDIVKRAFKAFQKPPQLLPSSLPKSLATSQSASRKADLKGSPANTFPKKNEGIGRAAKTATTRTVQQVTRTSLSPGVKKNSGADQRTSLAASFGSRVQLQGNNPKEATKKLESKPKLDATQLHSKLKVEKVSQVGTPSQNVISKSNRPSTTIHGFGGSVRKENGTSKMQASG
ncbi:hypothetical protein vseg_002111 [Gypsophila vaccaria]